MELLKRLLADDRAQDLIEYALLSATIGIACIAVWPAIHSALNSAYGNLDSRSQELWEPPAPGTP